MAKYLDSGALQAALVRKQCGPANQRYTDGWNDCLLRVKSMVSKAPAADVAPVVHGLWEKEPSSFWRWTPSGAVAVTRTTYRCGLCGRGTAVKSNYCPNCGAKMDGGDSDAAD